MKIINSLGDDALSRLQQNRERVWISGFFSQNIGLGRPKKKIIFHYLKESFPDQSIQNKYFIL